MTRRIVPVVRQLVFTAKPIGSFWCSSTSAQLAFPEPPRDTEIDDRFYSGGRGRLGCCCPAVRCCKPRSSTSTRGSQTRRKSSNSVRALSCQS